MTHRDGFPRLSARSAWRGDAGHREPCAPSKSHGPSESLGKPPFRSSRRTAGGRRKALTMSRIACGFPPTRADRLRDRNGGFPRLSDGVAHGLRCPASPCHALLAESLGKPSLWVIIKDLWYKVTPGPANEVVNRAQAH